MKVGLIGNGFVGDAIYQNLKEKHEFLIYDKDPQRSNIDSINEVCNSSNIIFIALPTPMQKNGNCDLSIIFNTIKDISKYYNNNILILKSTVPPGTCEKIKEAYPQIRLVFSPEFLTEANSIEDFKNCNRIIFGGDMEDVSECIKILSSIFPYKSYFATNWNTAEMVKYFISTFLATKVSFANEINQMCNLIGISYNEVKDLALQDKRISESHLMVPGPDGELGFGGSCFPKDLCAFINFAKEYGASVNVLKGAWKTNLEIRSNRDWEKLKGRAIS